MARRRRQEMELAQQRRREASKHAIVKAYRKHAKWVKFLAAMQAMRRLMHRQR